MYVANRVAELQAYNNPAAWNHVLAEDNPAEIVSIGKSAKELIN